MRIFNQVKFARSRQELSSTARTACHIIRIQMRMHFEMSVILRLIIVSKSLKEEAFNLFSGEMHRNVTRSL